ncbi:NAD(P)H-hydrate dehydratase [Salaquimonas pukyongi]|uniref:NAD(P)H-hydrate dehydratase n=1 Tax=Salaquimonas pukyongi TaxID=2712698 RepID=UPI00096B8268|nr:NAD(P)H-hydrate dehydratase [Salaquimonas pukyongi]
MTENTPALWKHLLPRPKPDTHKYDRGHAVIKAADELTGATRLAATACSRIGAGLVTVLSPAKADFFRAVLPPDIMVRKALDPSMRNVTAVLAGPGGGDAASPLPDFDGPAFKVLDAGALPLPGDFSGVDARTVLTPHDGEFARSFPDLSGTRTERTAAAAKACGGIVVLKGSETVIAAADGRHVVNRHASPFLAKAGTGDVLAGMICGLLAQGDPSDHTAMFETVCAAVWMHGEAGIRLGAGLTASDLESALPGILTDFIG